MFSILFQHFIYVPFKKKTEDVSLNMFNISTGIFSTKHIMRM